VSGQVEVATTGGLIESIALVPADPPVAPAAVEAIAGADWAFLGPGSWFTSVMPHLMVPELHQALVRTSAGVVIVLNLAGEVGETSGFGPCEHLAALREHAPDLRIHTVLADRSSVGAAGSGAAGSELAEVVASYGARLYLADVADGGGGQHHDPLLLAAAYAGIMAQCR
jgi:uncharacterized cofD-like protein